METLTLRNEQERISKSITVFSIAPDWFDSALTKISPQLHYLNQ
jgi:hypothetical protein